MSRYDAEGRELVLGVRGPGELLGEIGLLWSGTRSASITAIDRCEVAAIAGERFLGVVRNRGLETEILRHIISRLLDDERLRSVTTVRPAGLRLARGLLHLVDQALATQYPRDGADGVDLGLNQTELASAFGLSRQTVFTELNKLREDEVVTTLGRRVAVLRVGELRLRARRVTE